MSTSTATARRRRHGELYRRGMYDAQPCPACGAILWNGRCENPDCVSHWLPKPDDETERRRGCGG